MDELSAKILRDAQDTARMLNVPRNKGNYVRELLLESIGERARFFEHVAGLIEHGAPQTAQRMREQAKLSRSLYGLFNRDDVKVIIESEEERSRA